MAKCARWTVLGLVVACAGLGPPAREPRSDDVSAEHRPGLDALPWPDRIALERALAEDDPAHQPRIENGAPVLGQSAHFDGSGAHVRIEGSDLAIGLAAIGRRGAMRELGEAASATIVGSEVRIVRASGVVEWWRSLESGLEQGVTLDARPEGSGPLQLEMTTGNAVTAELASKDDIVLYAASHEAVAHYGHLVVRDASGGRVSATLAVSSGRIRIEIDDAAARYPLVVDPLVTAQEAVLLAPDGAAGDQFGVSVALSSDGSRALVGAHDDITAGGAFAGSARIFLRTGSTWVQEATLLAPDGAASDHFGMSVALSSDGSRALVGAYYDDTAAGSEAGSARVFLRSGTTWAQEATLLAPSGGAPNDMLGLSVALSADGSRALLGAPGNNGPLYEDAGCARVFLRTGTTWAQEATLLAPDAAASDSLGSAVALSTDGSRALVGAFRDDTVAGVDAGSARVFLRTGVGWALETTLVASGGAAYEGFGSSAAFSSDGSRALVGVEYSLPPTPVPGNARIFRRVGTTWAQEATLTAPDGAINDFLGASVALSSDGSRALVGAFLDDTTGGVNAGSARVFLRTGTSWVMDTTLLAPDGAAGDGFGRSVALSADGSRGLAGAVYDNTAAGSARVFTLLAGDGSVCGADAACTSGFCTDGVCCSTRCGGGSTDCQACGAALTGGANGTCAALSAGVASTVTCRPSTDVCDAPETCASTSMLCAVDLFRASGTVCRAALAGGCDVAETCAGTAAACPANVVVGIGTTCRPALGLCDQPETCNGTSGMCPTDGRAPASRVCRASAGACDTTELCDGTSIACPGDAVVPAGTTCRLSAGACDAIEVCDGTSFTCPGDALFPVGAACRPSAGTCDSGEVCDGASLVCPPDTLRVAGSVCRSVTGACDVEEICSGASATCPPDAVLDASVLCRPAAAACDLAESCTGGLTDCPADLFAPATTLCGPAPADVCDAADHCAGSTALCVETFLSGVECRPSGGACDVAELCSGTGPSCPPNTLSSSGVACRPSVDPRCDPDEVCDGVSLSCPADVIACTSGDAGTGDASTDEDTGPRADAGRGTDTGPGTDAGRGSDAGAAPMRVPGCGCRLASRRASLPAVACLFGAFAALSQRRRRQK